MCEDAPSSAPAGRSACRPDQVRGQGAFPHTRGEGSCAAFCSLKPSSLTIYAVTWLIDIRGAMCGISSGLEHTRLMNVACGPQLGTQPDDQEGGDANSSPHTTPYRRLSASEASPFGAATRQRHSRNGALWNFLAITPPRAICTWKSGAVSSRFCPDEAGTRIPCCSKTLRRFDSHVKGRRAR